ncbi:hypothetical protein V6255_04520 [Psychromonas arctica]|uniref:Uncharacterized protein n=1 Tax=Psychromonas arctica TaxID=168275 RepID=A0ABU9H938_9GAMM
MDIFNNRELASATLMFLLLSWASYKSKDVISGLGLVVKSLFKKTIIITIISLALYISIVLYGLYIIDVWNTGQIKNTVLWFTFVGFVQLLNTTNIKDPSIYLKASLNAQAKIIVLVQFLVVFHSFNYFAELLLVTVVTLLTCCNAYSQNKPEYKQAKKLCEYLLAIIGILLFSYSLFIIYQEPGKFFGINNLRNFIMPVLLSVALLPYTYCFYYFLAYERAFVKTHIYTSSRHLQRYAKIQSFIAYRGKVEQIHKWLLYTCISEFESKETICRSIYSFKQSTV